MRRPSRVILGAAVVLLAGCGRPEADVIKLAVQPPSTNNYPSHFAQWLGYYRDESVSVRVSQIAGASKVLEAVVAGSADIGGGVYEQTIQMAAEGKEVVCFVTINRSPNFAIVTAANSGVRGMEDLRGKAVGVSALGSPSQFYLNYMLGLQGMRISDVSTASVGMGASASAALEQGQVAAAVLFGSAITAQEARGARVLADSRSPETLKQSFGVDDYPGSCVLARREWLSAHPGDARKVARAIVRALAWIRDHGPEEILAQVPQESRVGDAAVELEAIRLAKPMYTTDGRISLKGAENVRRVLEVSVEAVRSRQIDLTRTYDNGFLPSPR